MFDSNSNSPAVYSEDQKEYACSVLPPTKEGGPLGLLLDYNEDNLQTNYFSHDVETHDGMRYKARQLVKIRETKDPKDLIDPLDFRYHNGEVFSLASIGYSVSVRHA